MKHRRASRIAIALVSAMLGISASAAVVTAVLPASGGTVPPRQANMAFGRPYLTGEAVSDPFVLTTKTSDYLYQTGNSGIAGPNVPVRSFTTMGQFGPVTDAMPTKPSWAVPDANIWAPDVRKPGSTSRYVMWFVAPWNGHPDATGQDPRCLSWALSRSPTGPFVDPHKAPIICTLAGFGDIDPRTFVDPTGQEWLYYRTVVPADVQGGHTDGLMAQRLHLDGTTLWGPPVLAYESAQPWEARLVEAPDMVTANGHDYLFYSADPTHVPQNSIGMVPCAGPTGPCTSTNAGPFLGSNLQGAGPGEESLFQQDGNTWLLYTPHSIYYPNAFPQLEVARVAFDATGPYLAAWGNQQPGQ